MLSQPSEIYENIPVFLKFTTVQKQIAAADPEVKEAVSLANTKSWKQSLEEVYGPNTSAFVYASDSRRQRFLNLVPFTSSSVVLEIGVGYGQHTVDIAKRVKHLDTYESQILNTLFTKIRCEQERATNVSHFCGGDDCILPFDSNRFDIVILNLVLEWCASENTEAPGVSGQLRLLNEINRVLKPGGIVQLNTKNRFALRYILGGEDEHLGSMRFGSALPRIVSHTLLAMKGVKARGHLHSYRALRLLLQQCSFEIDKVYEAYPEMRCPDVFVDSEAPQILPKSQMLGPSRRADLAIRLIPRKLRKHFTPGLFFLAHKT